MKDKVPSSISTTMMNLSGICYLAEFPSLVSEYLTARPKSAKAAVPSFLTRIILYFWMCPSVVFDENAV